MTPERRAEFAMLVGGALHQQPIFSAADLGEVLDALDMADARERRLREALELIAAENHASRISSVQRAVGIARAALSEVAPDA